METAVLLIVYVSPWFPAAFGINLVQTVPEEILACPGNSVSFKCTSETGILGWSEDGINHVFNNPNLTYIVGDEFIFELVSVTGNTFLSTARDPNISTADNGKIMGCFDEKTRMFQRILVTVRPANCQGTVTCTANPSSNDSSLTVISVSLVAPSDQSCVESYEFVFGNDSEIVGLDLPAVNFTIDKNLGLEYVDQQIFTLNAENVSGAESCNFSITEPSAILEVTCRQECNQTTMDITVVLDWDRPSLPVVNCLDASHLQWIYLIQVFNFFPSKYETFETHLAINGFPSSGEYSMVIVPVLPDLGLRGPPLNSTIVLNQTCPPSSNTTEPTSIIVVVVTTVLAMLIIQIMTTVTVPVIWWLCCIWMKGYAARYSLPEFQLPDGKKSESSNIPVKVKRCVADDFEDEFEEEPRLPGNELNVQELLAMEQQRVSKLQEEKDILIREKQQTEALVADLQQKLKEPGLSGDEVNIQESLAMEQQKVLKLQEEKDILIQEKKQTEALVADLKRKLEEPGLSGYEVNVQELLAMEQQKVFELQEENDILIQEKQQTEALVADVQRKVEESSLSNLRLTTHVGGSSTLDLHTGKTTSRNMQKNKDH